MINLSVIYLDHTATSALHPDVLNLYQQTLHDIYANPASIHGLGLEAEKQLTASRREIMKVTGQQSGQLVFTSGGSEAINLAIKGYLEAHKRLPKRLLTTAGEHAAVYETFKYYEQRGYTLEWLPLQSDGTLALEALEKALHEPAALLSYIHVSNETGAVNPIQEIIRLKNKLQPDLVVHADAVQAFGKTDFQFDQLGLDLASGSGHKLGAPKGIGWLAIRSGLRLQPQIHGGGQQDGLRSGTENPPMAAALAQALTLAYDRLPDQTKHCRHLRQLLLSLLTNANLTYQVVAESTAVPQILTMSFPGLRAETLVHALESKNIYVSSGSACSSKSRRRGNRVLQAMGLSQTVSDSAIRISLADTNTEAEIRQTAQALITFNQTLIRG